MLCNNIRVRKLAKMRRPAEYIDDGFSTTSFKTEKRDRMLSNTNFGNLLERSSQRLLYKKPPRLYGRDLSLTVPSLLCLFSPCYYLVGDRLLEVLLCGHRPRLE